MMRALAPSLLLMAAVVTWGGCDDDAPPPSDGGAQVADRGRRGGETDAATDSTGADQPVRDGDVEREFPVDENDLDGDGLSNECEDSVEGLDAVVADSDGDGLDDGEEDANQDCVVDEDETDPTLADSDGDGITDAGEPGFGTDPRNPDSDSDGLSDGAEVGRTETDPLDPDSDDDGCLDGVEDRNGDGRSGSCEPGSYAVRCAEGETDPNVADTDGDGIGDCEEVGYIACDPETLREPQLVRSEEGDYTVACETDVAAGDIMFPSRTEGLPVGSYFDDEANNIASFVVVLEAPSGETEPDSLAIEVLNAATAADPDAARRTTGRGAISHDDYETVVGMVVELPTDQSPEAARESLIRALSGDTGAVLDGTTASYAGDGDLGLVGVFQVLSRDESSYIVLGAITSAADYGDDAAQTGIRVDDFTGGSSLARFPATLEAACVSYVVTNRPEVDFIWSIDGSGSMSTEREDVSGFATSFTEVLARSDMDWRLGAIGGQCQFVLRDTAISPDARALIAGADFDCAGSFPMAMPFPGANGVLCNNSFSTTAADFSSCINVMSEFGGEYTLSMGAIAIDRALPRTPDSSSKIRPDAEIVLVVVTDEHEQSFEDMLDWLTTTMHHPADSTQEAELREITDRYVTYLTRPDIDATVFGIYWVPDEECDTGAEVAIGIHDVVTRTGGTAGSVCLSDITTTLEEIATAAAGLASTFRLSGRPIALTIKVARAAPGEEAAEVPRSRVDGYDFHSAVNRVVFNGPSVPETGDEITISYQRWVGGVIICESDDDCPTKFFCRGGECI